MAERAIGGVKMAYTTCRDALLKTVRMLVKQRGINEFTIKEVTDLMINNGTKYDKSTIGIHIRSRCCINGKRYHAVVYNDYRKLENGNYELINF